MNKTGIEWADYTWNPVTGCFHTCEYCYARKQALRFAGDVRLHISDERCQGDKEKGVFVLETPFISRAGRTLGFPFGFSPTLHKYRLNWPAKVKNSANIFVGSMTDLFGDWVPQEWILEVFEACTKYPHHNYIFLTKNPRRYIDLAQKNLLPEGDNYWYGTTTTTADSLYFYADNYNTFCSVEPLHGDFPTSTDIFCDWVIIGAESGNRKDKITPKHKWIQHIVDVAQAKNIPVFMKNSLIGIYRGNHLCDMPEHLCNKPISQKLSAKLYDRCCKCGTQSPMNKMVALLYREARGQSAKRLGYCCWECFDGLRKELETNERE